MNFIVAQKQGPHGIILIVTDKDLIGHLFSEGNKQLDLTKEFYHGEEKNKEQVKSILGQAQHLHVTGKHAVALGIEQNLIDPKRILWVQQVPHAEVVME
ncbi:TPA: DUF424 family protein [Candidatus Woesearchaeota archaeon]|nr:DUF424 family protein [Candidatus Woesearchaeota archaeon]HIH12862.1 DUF424 family protein [Candidatus Woesearchaeota archaeon]